MKPPKYPALVQEMIDKSRREVQDIVKNSTRRDSQYLIALYVAAFAVNFTDWIGKTLPWVRHEYARFALIDNLRCEATDDHVGMLINFARLSNALPEGVHYDKVNPEVSAIRRLFANPNTAGLAGVALCAVLESTSEFFIPDLAKRAKQCGCEDFTYTDVHGVADVEHSDAFIKATAFEFETDYGLQGEAIIQDAANHAVRLIRRIYS